MSDDPFSDILRFTDAQPVLSGGFTAGGRWAIRFPGPDKLKFFALVKGDCWLLLDGAEAPVRVGEGDVFLLCAPLSFVLAGDLDAEPVDAVALFAEAAAKAAPPSIGGGKFATLGEGEDCIQIGGHIRLDPINGGLLADVLPPLIHVRAPQAGTLRWLLDQLVRERVADLPGAGLASAQLAQLMFLQILRAHLTSSEPLAAGWLRAVSDRRLAPALTLMHAEPGRAWQLSELAAAAAMSRTSFALHFKAVAGVAPLAYLTQWRMRLAERALREDNIAVSSIARRLGYSSDSAFSNAFKRVTGSAPKIYRSTVRARRELAAE